VWETPALGTLLARIESSIQNGERGWEGSLCLGEVLGGFSGTHSRENCPSFGCEDLSREQTLQIAGNFNFTNAPVLFEHLIEAGFHPRSRENGELLLNQLMYALSKLPRQSERSESFDLTGALRLAAKEWDGGFFLCGVRGCGDAFALRDARGIRPAFYYSDDEIAVAASERAAIQTAFDLSSSEVSELPPGYAFHVMRSGDVKLERCLDEAPPRRCLLERIRFSRDMDADICRERRALGAALAKDVLSAVKGNLADTVFCCIPNTARNCYQGLRDALEKSGENRQLRFAELLSPDERARVLPEELALAHCYDTTYGVVHPGSDTIVVVDDFFARGKILREAVLPMLDRLGPRRIVICFSAPPLCYPDFYGGDGTPLGELVAFRAVISLMRRKDPALLQECAELAQADQEAPDSGVCNRLQPLYAANSPEELSAEIVQMLRPGELHAELSLLFPDLETLHRCCPGFTGDWSFSGAYPTAGGIRLVNRAFLQYLKESSAESLHA